MDCKQQLEQTIAKLGFDIRIVDDLVKLKERGEVTSVADHIFFKNKKVKKVESVPLTVAEETIIMLENLNSNLSDDKIADLKGNLTQIRDSIKEEIKGLKESLAEAKKDLMTSKKEKDLTTAIKETISNIKKLIKAFVKSINYNKKAVKILNKAIKDLDGNLEKIDLSEAKKVVRKKLPKDKSLGEKMLETITNEDVTDLFKVKKLTNIASIPYFLTVRNKIADFKISRKIETEDFKETMENSVKRISVLLSAMTLNNPKFAGNTIVKDGAIVNKKGYLNTDALELLNPDGKYTKETEVIIKLGMLFSYTTSQNIVADLLGQQLSDLQADSGLSGTAFDSYLDAIRAGSVPEAILAHELKSFVSDLLNLGVKSDADFKAKEQLVGAYVAHILQQLAVDDKLDKSKAGGRNFLKIDRNKIQSSLGSFNELRQAMSDIEYTTTSKKKKQASLKPIAIDETLMNSETKLDKDEQKLLKKNNNTKFTFHKSIEPFAEMWEAGKKTKIKKIFGYVDVDPDTMTIEEQIAVISVNNKITRELEIMFDSYKQFGYKPFHLNFGITKSKRMTVKSDLNYQNSKIHREFIHPKRLQQTIFTSNKLRKNIKDIDEHNLTNAEVFEIYLSQAFDLDPDKGSKMKIFKDIREVVDIYGDRVTVTSTDPELSWLQDFIDKEKPNYNDLTKAFAIGGNHTIRAVLELRALNQSKKIGSKYFKTNLTGEADAITSGVIIQLLQMWTPNSIDLVSKGGVFTKETRAKWEAYTKHYLSLKYDMKKSDIVFSMGALIEAGAYHVNDKESEPITIDGHEFESPFLDVYTTLGKGVQDALGDLVIEEQETPLGLAAMKLQELMGDLTLKKLRKMLKSPVMVFNYGALLTSVLAAMTRENVHPKFLEDETFREMVIQVAYTEEINKDNKFDAIEAFYADRSSFLKYDEIRNRVVPIEAKEFEAMTKEEKTKHIYIKGNKKIERALSEINNLIYRGAIDDSFNIYFSEITTLRNGIKAVDLLVSSLFANEFNNQKIETKKANEGKITREQLQAIIEDLESKGMGHTIQIGENTQPLYKETRTTEETDTVYVTIEGAEKGSTVGIANFEYRDNTGASSTISIHNIDAQVIAQAIGENDFESIYDAIIFGANHKDMKQGGDSYQNSFINVIGKHNVMSNYLGKLNDMAQALGADKVAKVLIEKLNPITDASLNPIVTYKEIQLPMHKTVLNDKGEYVPVTSGKSSKVVPHVQSNNNGDIFIDYIYTSKAGKESVLGKTKLFKQDDGSFDVEVTIRRSKPTPILKGPNKGKSLVANTYTFNANIDLDKDVEKQVSDALVASNKPSTGVEFNFIARATEYGVSGGLVNTGVDSGYSFLNMNIFNLLGTIKSGLDVHNTRNNLFNGKTTLSVNHLGLIGLHPKEIAVPKQSNPANDKSNTELIEAISIAQQTILDNIFAYLESKYAFIPEIDTFLNMIAQGIVTTADLDAFTSNTTTEESLEFLDELTELGIRALIASENGMTVSKVGKKKPKKKKPTKPKPETKEKPIEPEVKKPTESETEVVKEDTKVVEEESIEKVEETKESIKAKAKEVKEKLKLDIIQTYLNNLDKGC